ncbi:MAG: hypothetical protein COV01_00390 [Candidatus Taylorbacteria bacterium CG10_big_fil_rev_8_21_14_0_10_41_48]|uniref:Uncharacterized protein n=1 Tax=Candidatus Taylorbacteria bacterium CG10_big_fil_rev_8_21_14_0_10_41_48 TaxID=1975024 RepID=A0A2M8LCX2_9BACT|nr:MAG: hypothetical protein COV01_00390 [Candidatus Taylorbacteria bacterium CG10_big_fil_rev_8_21_14_0_10_41_48]
MKSQETEYREDLEKRLKSAFPKEWKELSQEKKDLAIDRFYKVAWLRKTTVKETLGEVSDRNLGIGLLLVGSVLAILGGLVVNILDRYFESLGLVYEVGAPALFFLFIWWFNKIFYKSLNDKYRQVDFLNKLLNDEID